MPRDSESLLTEMPPLEGGDTALLLHFFVPGHRLRAALHWDLVLVVQAVGTDRQV